ncbi:hypothetical protein ACWGDX_12970 [Streptomyces sp. NPDC055025]
MTEAQTIRLQVTQNGALFFEGDVQVYPWHIANYGGDWGLWLRDVAAEWVDRTASGIRDKAFQATASDATRGQQLAAIGFTHTSRTADEFIAYMDSRDPQELEADRAAAWGVGAGGAPTQS